MSSAHRPLSAFALALLLIPALAPLGCGPRADNSRVHLADPTENATVGPGDVFSMQVVGERDLPSEYQIASDGYVDLPYAHRVHAEGLEPQELAEVIRKRLIEVKFLADPSVIIRVREFNSKHITILGQVQKVGSFPFVPGLSMIQAISMAGGFSAIAKKDQVKLTRKTKTGTKTVILAVDAIMEGRSPDIPLQAGDQIYVLERVF